MQRVILPYVASTALSYFSTLSHNGTIFGKKVIEYKTRVLISVQLLSEIFITLRIIHRDIIINVQRSSCKVPPILVVF